MKYFALSIPSLYQTIFAVAISSCLIGQMAGGSESAEACSLAASSLEADLKQEPNRVLLTFGEAVRISPNCLRGLFRVAIRTSRPDEGLLKQMILVAMNEYPEEANTIAEICFEEAPDKADAIKSAFVSASKPTAKRAKTRTAGASVSPVDRFLLEQGSGQFDEEITKNDEADQKIQEAVAKMSADLKGKSGIIPTPKVVLPNALIEEKTIAGRVLSKAPEESPGGEASDNRIGSRAEEREKEHPVSFNIIDEITRGHTAKPIVIDDQPVVNRDAENYFHDRKRNDSPKKAAVSNGTNYPSVRRTTGPQSVYYIPPAAGSGGGLIRGKSEQQLNQPSRIILRSMPVSPTSPR